MAAAYADGTATPTPTPTTSAPDKAGNGQGPVTSPACTVTRVQNIGAGTSALMTISENGPSVLFQAAGEKDVLPGLSLSRTHPKLVGAGFTAEILRPDSSRPQLLSNMEGGGHKASVHDFPRLPKGCSFTYRTTDSTSSTSGGTQQDNSGTGRAPRRWHGARTAAWAHRRKTGSYT